MKADALVAVSGRSGNGSNGCEKHPLPRNPHGCRAVTGNGSNGCRLYMCARARERAHAPAHHIKTCFRSFHFLPLLPLLPLPAAWILGNGKKEWQKLPLLPLPLTDDQRIWRGPVGDGVIVVTMEEVSDAT